MAINVAYPGRDGAHSAAACDRLFPDGAELVPLPSFTAVVEAASRGDVEFGVLPIESSLAGPVAETHDLLYESSLSINGETILAIRHCLAGVAEVRLEEIRVVRSHPAALDQCRRLLAGMPWATAIAAATTADAAHEVAERADPSEAAIASERAARTYGLVVLAGDVGDHPEAYTRFVALARYTRIDREPGEWRTAFSFITDHEPGALHRAIEPFIVAKASGADAVDMESGALAATGRLAGVVRAISDSRDRPLGRLAFAARADGTTDWRIVARAFVTQPVTSVRTALAARRAIARLERAAEALR